MTMKRGKFIVFEGGEGSGKTEHVKRTATWLKNQKRSVITTHEPGGTALGKKIRNLLLENTSEPIVPPAELFLFLADRAQHVHTMITPALTNGQDVISDRFTGSTLAYQIGARGLNDVQLIKAMESYSRSHLHPDLVIYLDISPETGIERKQQQSGHTMNAFDKEDLKFHSRVHDYFLHLATIEPTWIKINGQRDIATVQKDIELHISSLLQL